MTADPATPGPHIRLKGGATTTHYQGKADLRLHWLGEHHGGIR